MQINSFDKREENPIENIQISSELASHMNSLYETRKAFTKQILKQISQSVSKIDLTKAQLSNLRK